MSSGLPSCTSFPPFRIAIRSPNFKASSKSWVINTMVFFKFFWSSSNWSCISDLISGSRALNASSINKISGSFAKARAKPTLCCIPPESWFGNLYSNPFKPTLSIQNIAVSFDSDLSTPLILSPSWTLSTIFWCGNNPNLWKTIPVRFLLNSNNSLLFSFVTSWLSTITTPSVGSIRRLMCLINVDFPEPDNPIITWIDCSSILILILSSPKTWLCFASNSSLSRPSLTTLVKPLALGPKILYKFSILIFILLMRTKPMLLKSFAKWLGDSIKNDR